MLLNLVVHAGRYRMMVGAHNIVVGAYKHLEPASMGSKTYQQTYPLPLTCKAIPFIYKRGCTLSNMIS